MTEKDRLYNSEITKPGDFVFDDRVVRVFPDMINRSVPGYGLVVPMIGLLARRYAQDNSRLYDLGCSLGAVSLAMQGAIRSEGCEIIAIDNSPEMIGRFSQILEKETAKPANPVRPVLQDIREAEISNASFVAMNFTLQFIDPGGRGSLLERIYRGMRPGAALVLSEKIRFEDDREQSLQTEWHHDFKRAQGYTDLEIARKRDALEHVMKPESLGQHRERLEQAGFNGVYRWYQGFNFVSMVAFR